MAESGAARTKAEVLQLRAMASSSPGSLDDLSVVIATWNYGRTLKAALESVRWAGEVIVVDSGSTDGTAALCEAHANVVVMQEPRNLPSLKFRRGIESARGGWLLLVAADEQVTHELAEEIALVVRADGMCAGERFDGFRIREDTYFFGAWFAQEATGGEGSPRLFRRGHYHLDPAQGEHAAPRIEGKWGTLRGRRNHYSNPHVTGMCSKLAAFAQMDADKATLGPEAVAGPWRIIWHTVKAFFRVYLKQRYWRQGPHGVMFSAVMAFKTFIELAARWERRYRDEHSTDARGF